MNTKLIVGLTLGFFVVAGCRKDEVQPDNVFQDNCDTTLVEFHSNDTVFPSDYIMAYPGSWWEYSDGSVIQSSTWQSVPVCSFTKPDCYEISRTYYVLPDFDGYWIKNENSVENDSDLIKSITIQLIGSFEGQIISSYRQGDYLHTTEYVEHFDTMNLGGTEYFDVIKTHYTYDVMKGSVSMNTVRGEINYYSKYVGVIKRINYDHNGVSVTKNLVNYHIEPY